ncbi:MAG: AbrB/MazE/SpoVT family DNA-binding domain-containing protein [Verrucomicrobiota bacterium]
MKASIIKIGNSRGIRIPKPVFEQCGFKEEVELEVKDDKLVVRPYAQARENWEAAFQAMAERGDDAIEPEYADLSNEWDQEDWEWK